ncbi:hybrid sensor histidine kinase/response regulator transcription factor [Adhaeribacter rhizoryzae]|uniref:histidine kinase n=1 Tax=Adhaeribacter rhizoryzae TaxID=2607907 RepID=A0A5M6DGW9_9BACT|nr:two-component regulator propeller domain-containing protein [Adhaeribacter rhizoryzae]KAA5546771.1 response regulator [Adhaeribacter rhizoryzae]
MIYIKWLLVLVSLSCFINRTDAAQGAATSPKKSFLKIANLDGYKVKCILKDKFGFMWFGTESGLLRYDGNNTVKISTNTGNIRLASDLVLALYEDRQANLWIGTGNGLQRLSPDRKSISTYLATSVAVTAAKKVIYAITQTHDGAIWCSADDGYLYRSGDEKSFLQVANSFAPDFTGLQRIVQNIAEDEKQHLWIADEQHGFRMLNLQGQVRNDFSLPANRQPIALFANKNSQLYVKDHTIYTYNPDKNKFISLGDVAQLGLIKNPIHYVHQDKRNFLWLVTQSELFRFDPITKQLEDFTAPFMQSGASYFQIECIYEDQNDQLWFGSYFGVYKLNNQESFFKTISLPKGMGAYPYFSTRGMLQSANNHLFIGSYSGFFEYNPALNKFKEYKIKQNNTWVNPLARALVPGNDSSIWMATESLGLLHFNLANKTFTPYLNKPKAPAKNKAPIVSTHNYSVLKDTQGQLWLGGYNNLYTLNPQTGQAQLFNWGPEKKSFPLLQILAIHQGRDKSIWLGTDYGLYRIQKEQGLIKHFAATSPGTKQGRLTHNFINCIYEDPAGNLWLGTKGGGINVFNPENGRVEAQYTVQDGLADDKVCAILPGAENQLWISTYNGLSRLDIKRKSFRNFHTADGLLTNEFNQGSALVGKDGNLYFGSMDGIIYFNPTKFLPAKQATQVMLTKLVQHKGQQNKIEETTLAISNLKQINLHYQDKFVTLYFALKNDFEPANANNQFAYKLAGLTNEWQNIGSINYIQLAGLPAGHYTLSLKAKSSNGYWGKELQIPILVGQAFYLSTVAYVVYALLILGIIGTLFWFRLNRIRLQNKLALEHLQKAKLEELNQLKTQFFTNITHEFRTPLTLIINPLEQLRMQPMLPPPTIIRQQHNIIHQNAQRLLRLINQLLDSAKLEAGSLGVNEKQADVVVFIGQLVETFRLQAQKKNIQLQYAPENNNTQYFFDAEKLDIIIYNLLSNALKFTPAAGTVQLELTCSTVGEKEDLLCLRVTDNGIGIPAAQLPFVFDRFYQVNDFRTQTLAGSGLGLFLVKELTELLGGHVQVESQAEKGTTFTITLPVRIADNLVSSWQESTPNIILPAAEIASEPLPQVATDAPLILVVEDHDELLTFISQELGSKYRVITATNGAEGWQLTQQELPDLIITDVTMPQMDGFSLCQKIKSTPLTTHIAVILLTAQTSTNNRVQGLSSGANDYLTKPFNLQELHLRVANWLNYQNTLRLYWHQKYGQSAPEIMPENLPEKPTEDPFLLKIYQILERELGNATFAVEQLASEMNVSTRTLHRKLSAITVMNANNLIRTYRLRKAAVLLQEGHSVSEVADLTGFEGLSYFSKCFKEQFAVSPSHYVLSQIKQS